MKKLQKVEQKIQIDRVKIDEFSVDFKQWLGTDLNLVNWNPPILVYHVILSTGMTDKKKTKTPE